MSQDQAYHAWLFLVKKGPGLGHFLSFLGVAKELKDPNTRSPIHVDVIWHINAFPLALVESGASLPCLAFFWSKKGQVWDHFLPFFGVAKEKKDPNTCFPVYVEVIWPIKAFPSGLAESGASLPCLAFFGQKWARFGPFSAIFGSCQGAKGP